MVRNNFYKLGIYAERQVPYLPKFIHKYLLAREQCSSLGLHVWLRSNSGIYTPLTRKYILRKRIEQHLYFTAKGPQADRQTGKPTTEWTLLLRLLQHMVELRQSKATGCLLGAPQLPCYGHATWTWLRTFVMFPLCVGCCSHCPISFAWYAVEC